MHTRRTGRLLAGLSLLFLFGSFLGAPASAAPAPSAPETEKAAPAVPPPPPPPVGADGKRLPGAWYGPYTYRNFHSGKCLDTYGNSIGATTMQYDCLGGEVSQAWYEWIYDGDGSVAIFLIGNSETGGCASGIEDKGGVIWHQVCAETEPQTWVRTVANLNEYWNQMTGLCMEVGGWSTANGAAVISWDCFGNPNQLWAKYDWH
jgi:hypothetical protein